MALTRSLRHGLTGFMTLAAIIGCHRQAAELIPRPLPEITTQLAPGDVAGFVLDSTSGMPIANVNIEVRHDSSGRFVSLSAPIGAITDSLGRFHLRRIPPGSYALVARFIAYHTRVVPFTVSDTTGAVVVLALQLFSPCPPGPGVCY